jgi:hypothetical protein
MPYQAVPYHAFPESERLAAELVTWYGFPADLFADYAFWQRPDSGSVSMAPHVSRPLPELEYEAFGLLVLRTPRDFHAVSTAFIRRFGQLATQHVLRPEGQALTDYMQGVTSPWPERTDSPRGFEIVVGPEGPLGRGLWRSIDGVAHLESEFPKQYRPDWTPPSE